MTCTNVVLVRTSSNSIYVTELFDFFLNEVLSLEYSFGSFGGKFKSVSYGKSYGIIRQILWIVLQCTSVSQRGLRGVFELSVHAM